MAEIYMRDNLLPKDYDGKSKRRTSEEIQGILAEVIPRAPKSVKQTKLGYRIFYDDDADINFFFKIDKVEHLKTKLLTPQLSYNSQEQRELYIIDISEEIYKKTDSIILLELEQENSLTILILEKFTSHKTNKRYLKLTLDSKNARDNMINKGLIKAFNENLTVLPKKSSKVTMASGTDPQQPQYGWQQKSSAQHQGLALSSDSNWAGNRSKPYNSTQGNRNQPKPGLLPTPLGLQVTQNNQCNTTIKLYMEAFGVICDRLSSGLENPDLFVATFNDILHAQGYPTVNISQDILDTSRIIYKNKNTNNIFPGQAFNYNPNFHSPNIFQQSNAPLFQHHPHQGSPPGASNTYPLNQAPTFSTSQTSTSTGATPKILNSLNIPTHTNPPTSSQLNNASMLQHHPQQYSPPGSSNTTSLSQSPTTPPPQLSALACATANISNISTGYTDTNTITTPAHPLNSSISAFLLEARPPPMSNLPNNTSNSSAIPSSASATDTISKPHISPPKGGTNQASPTGTPDPLSLSHFPNITKPPKNAIRSSSRSSSRSRQAKK